jgi:hypothetical protein
MAVDTGVGGWTMSPFGAPSQSTMQHPLSPSQVQQIQATTGVMAGQPSSQQASMMNGLFGAQSNLGQNLGSMGQSLWGGTPAFGGGNIFGGDAYGGSAQNPILGLTAADYG